MPNFSSLAGLEVAEKFLWGGEGGWGGVVCTVIFMSNPPVVLRLGWGFDNMIQSRHNNYNYQNVPAVAVRKNLDYFPLKQIILTGPRSDY